MFIHSAFPITMSKPVYWMFVGALFRDSASKILNHYKGYVEKIEEEANALAKKQVEEEENKIYYLDHKEELEREYELLLHMNSSRSNKVVLDDQESLNTVIKTWSTGGAQDPETPATDSDINAVDNTTATQTKMNQIFNNVRQWRWPPQNQLEIDYNHSSKPPFHNFRKMMNMAKGHIPLLRELDPDVAAEKATQRELKREAKQKEKRLKEAAKVNVDYRPVMSRIIDDYLFRCPSWHYANKVSRNRVQNSEDNITHKFRYEKFNGNGEDSEQDEGRTRRQPKHKYKRSRNNNNIYVYR